jgi:hypothetical protein
MSQEIILKALLIASITKDRVCTIVNYASYEGLDLVFIQISNTTLWYVELTILSARLKYYNKIANYLTIGFGAGNGIINST